MTARLSFPIFFAFVCIFVYECHSAKLLGQDPGAIVTIGGEALASGLTKTLPNVFTSKLQNQTIASIAGTTRALGIFDVTYNITDLFLYNFEFGEIEIATIDNGFEIELTGIVCNVSFNWYYKDQSFFIIHVSDSGSGTMDFYDGKYEIKMKIKENDGRPHFDITKNNLALGPVDLDLDGGANWFYDLFNFVITPVVKRQVQDKVQDIIGNVFDAVNNEIDKIPTTLPLVENIAFTWTLVSDFETNESGFGSFNSAAYFVPQNNENASPPFAVQSIPSLVNSETAQVIISEFTFQTLGWALYEAGSLNVTIPFGTTSDWRLLLPALYRAYPKEDVEINLVFNVYPSFTLNSTGLTFSAVPYMNWNIVSNGTVTNAFTLLVQLSANIDLYFEDTMLKGKAAIPTFDMSLYSSNIGDFSLFQLETAVNTVLYAVLLPTINGVLRDGIPVPEVLGVTLKNPMIEFETGYMYITTALAVGGNSTNSTATATESYYTFLPYPMMQNLFAQ